MSVRAGCHGIVAMQARLEPWQVRVCEQPVRIAAWLEEHGSPLNLLYPAPLARNAEELARAARAHGIDFRAFFARKANKALALVDAARTAGLGVDVASEAELRQTLGRGLAPADIVVTAAVKPRGLLALCVARGVTVVIDNGDELAALAALASDAGAQVPVAFRLAPLLDGERHTRFGLAPPEIAALLDRHWPRGRTTSLRIAGVHFHLDGYSAADRVRALGESLAVVELLRECGHQVAFVDIGGGVPMRYLEDAAAWEAFWNAHRDALLGLRAPLTFDGHGLGLLAHGREILGQPNVYPVAQRPIRGEWLDAVLAAPAPGSEGARTVAGALREHGLELRCEPGRALVDGCGLTAARVEFRKQRRDGTWLIGLAMNRTQCRSAADDFLVDPLLLRPDRRSEATGPIEGFLVGAYCIERELLTWRRLRFPLGVAVGDIVVFPNTAGYQMHILESPSHQIPLARNLVLDAAGAGKLDLIDVEADRPLVVAEEARD